MPLRILVTDGLSRAAIIDPSPEDIEVETVTSSWILRTVRVCATELNDIEESGADHLSDPVLKQLQSVPEADPDYQSMTTVMEVKVSGDYFGHSLRT